MKAEKMRRLFKWLQVGSITRLNGIYNAEERLARLEQQYKEAKADLQQRILEAQVWAKENGFRG